MNKVVSGIVFMHDNGIIHLDIKPNNIVCVSRYIYLVFIQARGQNQLVFRAESNLQVKIIDFGLAKDIQVQSGVL